jgi:gamma-glutamylaminecyclotransferase
LIAGQPNHQVLTETENGICEFVGKANTINKWPLIIASKYNIPYLLHKSDFGKVWKNLF